MKAALCIMAVALGLLTGCRQKDVREMVIRLPGVKTAEEQAAVKNAIAPLIGIEPGSVVFDAAKQELHLMFDSMQVRYKNVEIAIAEAGFDANEVPAIPKK